MPVTVEKCKYCGASLSFDKAVPHFRLEAAPLIVIYPIDCPACHRQNTFDYLQSMEEYLEETRDLGAPEGYQTCPDCAELIQADARVCRFCGHRLAPPPAASGRA